MIPDFNQFEIFALPENLDWANVLKGKQAGEVFIAYRQPDSDSEINNFLAKVLAAAKLQLEEDCTYLPLEPNQQFLLSQLPHFKTLKTAILFGLKPQEIGLQINAKPYMPVKLSNVRLIFVDDLSAIYEERQSGGKKMSAMLWNILKAEFLS